MRLLVVFVFFIALQLSESVIVCPTLKDYFTYKINSNCYNNPDGDSNKPSEMITRRGFETKEYNITTTDGYIISVERLYRKIKMKTPIIIGSGIYLNSIAYVSRGNKSLGIYLADHGYDVWIINWRGTRFSRGHIFLTPKDREYWNMGFHEMAIYDLKAVSDLVHVTTGRKGIYIGYSMGTTIGFIYNIKEQDSAERTLKNIIHLAPITTLNTSTSILKYLNPLWPLVKPFALKLWNGELLPYSKGRNALCLPYPLPMQIVCELIYLPIFGTSQVDPLTYPVTTLQHADSISIGTVEHYSQLIRSHRFQELDLGIVENLKKYNKLKPPLYNLEKITIPQTFFVGTKDILCTPQDSRLLYDQLPEKSKCGYNLLSDYGHRDYLNANNIIEVLFRRLLHTINQLESGNCKNR